MFEIIHRIDLSKFPYCLLHAVLIWTARLHLTVCAVAAELVKITYHLVHSTNCGCKPVSVNGIATRYVLDVSGNESSLLRASVWLGCSRSEYSSGRKWKAVKWRQPYYVSLSGDSRRDCGSKQRVNVTIQSCVLSTQLVNVSPTMIPTIGFIKS